MAKQSNIRELASRLGQLTLAECEPYRDELLALLNDGAAHPFRVDMPIVVLLRALGRAADAPSTPSVDDLDPIAGRVVGEAAPDAEQRVGVLPRRARGEASVSHRRDLVDADRHVRIGVR